MDVPGALELRRGVLAVSVLHDVDVSPDAAGVTLDGDVAVRVPWTECRRALAGHDPEDDDGRRRLTDWLLARRWAADAGREMVLLQLRPVGLPVEHLLHPGLDWVRQRVLGESLDLGLGAVGLDPAEPDRVVLLPAPVLDELGIDADVAWRDALERLERLGSLAAERALRDPKGVLKPFGDCDVVTLLGARSMRAALADAAGGMAAVVAPMRRRGWSQLARIDPAFGPAAAAATPAADRGFPRPLLLTADELTVVAEHGRPAEIVLRDPAADAPWVKDVLYR